MKRAIDIVVSILGLVIVSPIIAIAALLIRADGPGPIVFIQSRVGRNRVPFNIFKLRTMVNRAPSEVNQLTEVVLSSGSDSRVTRVGRILRATSIDELPQLVNVLRGEMSLIGPRPLLPEQLAAIPEQYFVRFEVNPGLTGLAQVRGRRGLDWLKQLAADAEYVEHQSLKLDCQIAFRTIQVLVKGSGIYGESSANWRNYLPDEKAQHQLPQDEQTGRL